MMKPKKQIFFFAALSILASACATSAPHPKIDEAGAKVAEATDEAARAGEIQVKCVIYLVGGGTDESPGACRRIDFALEDLDEVEVARKNPDRDGKITFTVAPNKAFQVIPKVPSAWTIEVIPAGDLKAGDSVRVILRR